MHMLCMNGREWRLESPIVHCIGLGLEIYPASLYLRVSLCTLARLTGYLTCMLDDLCLEH